MRSLERFPRNGHFPPEISPFPPLKSSSAVDLIGRKGPRYYVNHGERSCACYKHFSVGASSVGDGQECSGPFASLNVLVTSQIARLMTTTNTDTTGPWGRNAMDIRGGLVFTIFPRKSNPQVGFQVYCTTFGFSTLRVLKFIDPHPEGLSFPNLSSLFFR